MPGRDSVSIRTVEILQAIYGVLPLLPDDIVIAARVAVVLLALVVESIIGRANHPQGDFQDSGDDKERDKNRRYPKCINPQSAGDSKTLPLTLRVTPQPVISWCRYFSSCAWKGAWSRLATAFAELVDDGVVAEAATDEVMYCRDCQRAYGVAVSAGGTRLRLTRLGRRPTFECRGIQGRMSNEPRNDCPAGCRAGGTSHQGRPS